MSAVVETINRAPLLTWMDVDRRINELTHGYQDMPAPIRAVECYSDALEVFAAPGESSVGDSLRVLKQWFSEAEFEDSEDGWTIHLSVGSDSMSVVLITDETSRRVRSGLLPLWKRLVHAREGGEAIAPPTSSGAVEMFAFHSFKGGVGRTTSLLTFVAAHLALVGDKRKPRILVIDADTEAPGITYLLGNYGRGDVSFPKFVEALHSSPSGAAPVIGYFAGELRKQQINVEGAEIFVLPAFVSRSDLLDARIYPQDIVRGPDGPWALGTAIQKLAAQLGVDRVFVDLRAGLSEISSPILFDPRFQRFIVSTLADQSLSGVELVLQCMRRVSFGGASSDWANHPCIVFSMLTNLLKTTAAFPKAMERVENAYGLNSTQVSDDNLQSNLTIFESEFSTNLMVLQDFVKALGDVKESSLYLAAEGWVKAREERRVDEAVRANDVDLNKQAGVLAEICRKKRYAEDQEQTDLLATEALTNLGRSFVSDVPNAVLIGAKGSGKTFSYLQIAHSKDWATFLKKVGLEAQSSKATLVLPLLQSNELGDVNKGIIRQQAHDVFAHLADGSSEDPQSHSELQDSIQRQLAKGDDSVGGWISFWATVMASAVGSKAVTLSELNSDVLASGKNVVYLFDGIEDVLRQVLTSDSQRIAVDAIIEIPNRIRELRSPAIGVLAFVREDYAKAAKTQNFGQFESRYQKYRLDWSPREFLQLVVWLCAEARIPWASKGAIQTADTEGLVLVLERLWGRKLGRDSSAEAYTAKWVYAALSDLKGRLQARDVVTFLANAADQAEAKRQQWNDRVLPPTAIRSALIPTSISKVEEAVQEYESLRQWRDSLLGIDAAAKKIPFAPEDLKLDGRLRQSLQDIGVIYEDIERAEAERIYVPEIYRHGLGLSSGVSARPRVQALLQRSLGSLPF